MKYALFVGTEKKNFVHTTYDSKNDSNINVFIFDIWIVINREITVKRERERDRE